MKRIVPFFVAIFAVACAYAGDRQFMKDIDRREIAELKKIQPPPDATELKLIRAFPSSKQEEAGEYLPQPDSFVCDSLGNYYIADQKTNVIYKYDPSGKYLGLIGKPGQGPGDLYLPRHIDIIDDVLVINDVGNRRVQKFDLKGQDINSTRISKSYADMIFAKDGKIIGAPLSLESPGEGYALVEIMGPDGKIIRAFGTPIEFKYGKSVMNGRRIIIKDDREIIVVFRVLPILRRYSLDGRLLQERRLKTEFSFRKEKINLRMNSYLPDHKVGNYVIFPAAEILDETIYLVDHVPPRLWIWAIDADFRVTHTYWANVGDHLFVRDFIPFRERGQINFALLGSLTPYEEKINIFTPKKEILS
jgi:hypothetical protein